LAAELNGEFGADGELVASHGGVFEVKVDGTLIFSKKASGRFPDDGEIVKLIRQTGKA
jgi:selenoprotein W-related protein